MIEHSAGHVRAVASEKLYPQNLKHARFIMSVKAYRPYGKLSRAKVVKMTRTPMKIAAVVIISAGIGLSTLGTAAAGPLPEVGPIADTGSFQGAMQQQGSFIGTVASLLCVLTGGHPHMGMGGPLVCYGGLLGSQ